MKRNNSQVVKEIWEKVSEDIGIRLANLSAPQLSSLLFASHSKFRSRSAKTRYHSSLEELASAFPVDYFLCFVVAWVRENNEKTNPDEIQSCLVNPLGTALNSLSLNARNSGNNREFRLFMHCLESLARHAAKHEAPKGLLQNIYTLLEDSVCDKKIKFRDLAQVKQSYWVGIEHHRPAAHYAHRTIRINAIPFAEATVLYRMSCLAHDHGINLELVDDIPWKDVGRALVTNRIDVAFYNKAIEKQLGQLKHVSGGRVLSQSETALKYRGYFIIEGRKAPSDSLAIAVVSNSDHEEVLKDEKDTVLAALKGSGYIKDQTKVNILDRVVPVNTPDDAVSLMMDGEVTHCLAGGIHTNYLERTGLRKGVKVDNKIDLASETELHFYTLTRTQKEMQDLLRPTVAIWNAFVSDWPRLEKGLELDPRSEINTSREDCVTYVNRDPHQAFVSDWDELRELIVTSNSFKPLKDEFQKAGG